MEQSTSVKKNIEAGILTIIVDNPEHLNILSMQSIDDLREVMEEVYHNEAIKGVILTGAGSKAFVTNINVEEFIALNELNARKFAENGQEVFALIENCHKPIIAAVNGYALGSGCELALACHIRMATDNAKFGLPASSVGMIPAFGGTQRLTQLIGKGRAYEMLMTGEAVNAQMAHSMGLVNHLARSQELLLTQSRSLLQKIIANSSTAIGMLVNCVNAVYNTDQHGYQTEANSFANCCKATDFKEGITAFLEQRKPEFKGK